MAECYEAKSVTKCTNAKAVTVRPQRFQKVNYDRIRHEFQPTEQWTALEMNRRTFWHRFLIMAECYEVRTQKLSRFEHNDHCRKSSMIGFVITDSSLRIRCLCTNPNTTDQAGKHVFVRQIGFVEKREKLDQLDDLNLLNPIYRAALGVAWALLVKSCKTKFHGVESGYRYSKDTLD